MLTDGVLRRASTALRGMKVALRGHAVPSNPLPIFEGRG